MPDWRRLLLIRPQSAGSYLRRLAVSIALGTGIAAVAVIFQSLIEHHPLFDLASWDTISTAILSSLVVFVYEQKRHRATEQKLRIIAEMNHHVRNALQVLISSTIYSTSRDEIAYIAEAVGRVEWALREVLPGTARASYKARERSRRTAIN